MSKLCKYKDSLGISGKGIHSYRVFDIAIVDLMMTIIASYLIARIFHFSFLWTFIVIFIIGEILHYIFCVPTTVIRFITGKKE